MSANLENAVAAPIVKPLKQRFFGSRIQRTLLAVIGLLNMIVGGIGILYVQLGHGGILLLDLPNECACKMPSLKIHSYVESTFQILLGVALICLLMTKRSSRSCLGTCWVWFGLCGLILSVANFVYSFTHACNPVNPFYFAVWFAVHMTEIMCVGYYARSQGKPKKRFVTLAEVFQTFDTIQQMQNPNYSNSNEKIPDVVPLPAPLPATTSEIVITPSGV